MAELYFIFIGVAVLLFAAIVGYSYYQKQTVQKHSKVDYVDPLFEELEQRKTGSKAAQRQDAVPPTANTPPAFGAASQAKNSAPESTAGVGSKTEPTLNSPAEGLAQEAATDSVADIASVADDKSPSAPPASGNTGRLDRELGESSTAKPDGARTATPRAVPPTPAPHELPQVDAASTIVTELVARVKNPAPIEQQELLKLFRNHDFKFHRKVHIYGLNELTDLWRDIEFELPAARFVELGVAIQLADRDGAMSNKEWHDFQQMALAFSNSFDAPFEFSMDIDEALKQAQILDQIGRRYDSMAVLNVVPRAKTGFRMADIESCARDLMMSTDKNGIFVKTRGQKQNLAVLYRLACTDGSGHFGVSSGTMAPVHDLVIYMNVPATESPDRVFQDMVKDANNLATWLDGKVVDRNGKVMTQRSYSVLMQQISDIAYSMQQDGLVPGDVVSKKLF